MSVDEVRQAVDVPVIMYAEFAKMKTLTPACIYLFLTNDNYGHFCSVFRKGNTVEMFDPYGIKPETEHKFVHPELLAHLHESRNLVLDMCKKNGWSVVYNHTQLQSWNPKVETCGRHSVERCRKRDWDIETYVAWLTGVAKSAETTPDILASYLVSE